MEVVCHYPSKLQGCSRLIKLRDIFSSVTSHLGIIGVKRSMFPQKNLLKIVTSEKLQ